MNTKASLSLVVLSAVILSACTTKAPTVIDTQAGEQPAEQSSSKSLRDLIGLGQSQTCTFTSTLTSENDVTTNMAGTLYISGKNLAETVKITGTGENAKTIEMNLISDGTNMYSWDPSSNLPGIKMEIPAAKPDDATAPKTNNGGVDLDKKLDMKCSPWVVDNSKFVVPTTVKFTDVAEMMKNIPTMPANIPTVPAIPGY